MERDMLSWISVSMADLIRRVSRVEDEVNGLYDQRNAPAEKNDGRSGHNNVEELLSHIRMLEAQALKDSEEIRLLREIFPTVSERLHRSEADKRDEAAVGGLPEASDAESSFEKFQETQTTLSEVSFKISGVQSQAQASQVDHQVLNSQNSELIDFKPMKKGSVRQRKPQQQQRRRRRNTRVARQNSSLETVEKGSIPNTLCSPRKLQEPQVRIKLPPQQKCPKCPNKFQLPAHLRQHMKAFHDMGTPQKVPKEARKLRPTKCPECAKVVASPGRLKLHMIVHTNSKGTKTCYHPGCDQVIQKDLYEVHVAESHLQKGG